MLDNLLDHEAVCVEDATLVILAPEAHIWLSSLASGTTIGPANRRYDKIAGIDRCDAIPDRLNNADRLVTDHQLVGAWRRSTEFGVDDLLVGTADTRAQDADEDLVRSM